MAKVIPVQKERFSAAFDFLERELPLFPEKDPNAWIQFKKFSNLTDQEATGAVRLDGSAPLIFASPLGDSTWGLFDPDAPARISLSTSVLTRFKDNATDPDAQQFLIAKVLHELCHWGCFRKKVADDDEAGEKFENGAFGKELQPWWATIATTPLQPGISATSQDVFTDANARAAACKDMLFKPGNVPGRVADPARQVFSGADVSEPMPRGYRNNNPGNIRNTGIGWRGLSDMGDRTTFQQIENNFCVFREPEWGIRAMAILLRTYKREHNLITPRAIISRYAPAGDNNDVNSYSSALAAALNVDRDSVVNADDDAVVLTMIRAMARHENGVKAPYSDVQLQTALLLI